GKDPAAALKLLDQALELAARDKELISINYASILVNHSVAAGAAGPKKKMAASLDKAEALLSKMLSTPVRNASPEQRSKIFAEYVGPVVYNRAISMAGSQSQEAKLGALSQLDF